MGVTGIAAFPRHGEGQAIDIDADKLSLGHLAAGVASVILTGGAATTAWAQDVQLDTVEVRGNDSPENTLQSDTGVARLGRVQDIPQTVNVINQQTLQQQGVTTLDQALRNVPGVTVAIGEGGGGLNGDQFRIRGFQAKGDIYVDGLRDFGVYVRDSFAYEQVQVIKGPSSESFGVGTTGGAINNVLKNAHLGNTNDIEGTLGMGPFYRGVVDVNRQVNDTTAVRIVAMGHDQDLVDRDHMYTDRWGVLGSTAFGLGTDTTLTLNYLHQHGDRQPDMGQPIITILKPNGRPAFTGRPISEFGVPRSNYYGKETDNDNTNVDMFTARFKSEVTDWLTVSNDTRLAKYDRYFAQTVVSCPAGTPTFCANNVANGEFDVPYNFGGPAGYMQDTWGGQNITTAVAKFSTGWLRHELTAGVDASYQKNDRTQLTNSRAKNPGTIEFPKFNSDFNVGVDGKAKKKAEGTDFALFGSDRVWLTEQWSVLGGVRWDRYDSEFDSTETSTGTWLDTLESTDDFVSPTASVIWEPTKQQTYYLTWSKSYSNLAGQFISNESNAISNETLKPENNELWELGSKINLLDGRLGLTAALFRIKKGNSTQTDPTTGDVVQTNETQRVQGVELGLTGNITDQWVVQLAYAHMESKILSATEANAATIGNRVSFVPENAASLWTTYDIAPTIHVPGKLLVGGGFVYTDDYFVNSTNYAAIPSSFVVNALISYEHQNYRIALNGYNLTDELYYEAAFGNRAVVAPGRTVTLTAGYKW